MYTNAYSTCHSFCIISFSDADTHTSEIKFIKQAAGLNLGKLTDLAILHWEVVHDKIGVQEASMEISDLMRAKPYVSEIVKFLARKSS